MTPIHNTTNTSNLKFSGAANTPSSKCISSSYPLHIYFDVNLPVMPYLLNACPHDEWSLLPTL